MNITSSEPWYIREALAGDLQRISELLFTLKILYGSTPATTLEQFQALHLPGMERALACPLNALIVACDKQGALVGFISITIRTVLRVPTSLGSIEELFVSPEYRKRGVATALWKKARKVLRQQGVERVEVISSLAHPGQRQFAKSIGMDWYSSIHVISI